MKMQPNLYNVTVMPKMETHSISKLKLERVSDNSGVVTGLEKNQLTKTDLQMDQVNQSFHCIPGQSRGIQRIHHVHAATAEIFSHAITGKLFDLTLSNLVCGYVGMRPF